MALNRKSEFFRVLFALEYALFGPLFYFERDYHRVGAEMVKDLLPYG